MSCSGEPYKRWMDRLFQNGSLRADKRTQLTDHLRECRDCRAYYDEATYTERSALVLTDPRLTIDEPSNPEYDRILKAVIDTTEAPRPTLRDRLKRWGLFTLSAALVAALIASLQP